MTGTCTDNDTNNFPDTDTNNAPDTAPDTEY